MAELIENALIECNINNSRTFQEAFRLQEGESTYAILAGCIEVGEAQIDAFARFCGTAVGYAMIERRRDKAYHNEKNGKVSNWVNRNLYQNAIQTQKRHYSEELFGVMSSAATEWLIKAAAKGLYDYAGKKANYEALEQVYLFLRNYAMTDSDISNVSRAQKELSKIRNGFPLNDEKKRLMVEHAKDKPVLSLEDLPSMSVLVNNPDLCESLAYHVFDLYCYKFGDNEGVLAEKLAQKDFSYKGMNNLLEYYDYLGFTGKHARELIRVNANRYDTICRDQEYYLQLGRKIMREFSLNIPNVDMNRIKDHCDRMIKYDPYQLRRRKMQNASVGMAEGLAGLFMRRPDIVMNGGSLALSQFDLEDGSVSEIMQREFKKLGIGVDEFNAMLNQSAKIAKKTKDNA